MPGLAPVFGAILDRFAKFFDVLDLSYFISGAVAVSAFMWWAKESGVESPITGPAVLAATVLGCYVVGLMCFAVGRLSRLNVSKLLCRFSWRRLLRTIGMTHRTRKGGLTQDDGFEPECELRARFIRQAARDHCLTGDVALQPYFDAISHAKTGAEAQRSAWSLYTRVWAEARQQAELKASLDHLNRSWVISATYDGLAVALSLWVLALGSIFMFGSFSQRFQLSDIDIKQASELVCQVKQHLDEPSAYLYGLLDKKKPSDSEKSLKAMIDGYGPKTEPTTEMRMGVLYLLNTAIADPKLSGNHRFARTDLSFETRRIMLRNPRGERLVALNKLLLEDAFPGALPRHSGRYTAAGLAMIGLVLLIWSCGKEASRHFGNQVEELFATYAWWTKNRPPG